MKCKKTLKPLAAAIGLGLALTCGHAAAAIPVSQPVWQFEDDDVDFVGQLTCTTPNDASTCTWTPDANGTLNVGDVLIATFEITSAGGVTLGAGEELTGIAVVQIVSITDLDGSGGSNDLVFGAVDDGLNAVLGLAGLTGVTGGQAGGGATIAWYDDVTPNYSMSGDTVVSGTESCTSLVQCLQQAGDGSLFQVDGFGADADNFWISLNPQTNTTLIVGLSAAQTAGAGFNAGQSILFNGTGQNLVLNGIDAGILGTLAAGSADNKVDMLISGVINGGLELGAGLKADGAVATSDAQAQKLVAVPEPASLALLGIGLAGLGAVGFRRK